jgi:hypothetical protein
MRPLVGFLRFYRFFLFYGHMIECNIYVILMSYSLKLEVLCQVEWSIP